MAAPGAAGGRDGPAGPGGHLQEALQAQGDSEAAGPGERAAHSQRLSSASFDTKEASEGMPREWRCGGGKKISCSVFSLYCNT